ncbi:MAG: homoserine O-succinyltransferase [Rhodospirillaceae bacterium]|nr:homoserine O-succinyltransferase [Rhodospirillaceae bacterium]|tara:strand:+ start:1854 stop:2771 length:918 start_codon:yes stop_codon:yes gene_type:complete
MPIKIPQDLPATDILEKEGVLLIKENDAIRQDIRPLKIALLNLMPKKIETETQIARVLAGSPLQVEMTLLAPTGHQPKNTSREHMLDFYRHWEDVRLEKFDGMIVTGAPIEQIPFEEVTYWAELCSIFDWSRSHVHGLFTLCWGAQAALYHFYKIPKYQLRQKLFGIYQHSVRQKPSILLHGLDDQFTTPVSRHTENRVSDLQNFSQLEVLIDSKESGLCLIQDTSLRHLHMFNHLEYDSTTLHQEYLRDLKAGDKPNIPVNYYPENNPSNDPINTWRGNGHLLFSNWVNYLYQTTPFCLEDIGN